MMANTKEERKKVQRLIVDFAKSVAVLEEKPHLSAMDEARVEGFRKDLVALEKELDEYITKTETQHDAILLVAKETVRAYFAREGRAASMPAVDAYIGERVEEMLRRMAAS
jgi:hypothetical protein